MTQLVYPTTSPLHSTLIVSLQIRKEEAILHFFFFFFFFFLQNVFDKARNTIKQARENQWWLIQNIVYANKFYATSFCDL